MPYALLFALFGLALLVTDPGAVQAQTVEPVFRIDGAFQAGAQGNAGSGIGGDDPDVMFMIKNSANDPDDILLRVARANNTFRFKVDDDGDIHFPGLGGTASGNDWTTLWWSGASHQIKITPFSSRRFKTDIQPHTLNVEPLLQAELKTWNGIGDEADRQGVGFIVEDIEALGLTDLIIYNEQGRPDGLRLADFHLYLAELMRRHRTQLNELDDRLDRQNAEALRLQDEVTRLLSRIAALESSTR